MTTDKFKVAEAIGIASVVFSLLVVAYEIRQTNQIAIVTAEIELRNNYSALNELMAADTELTALLVRLADPEYQTTPAEDIRLRSFAFRFLNIWIASEIAFQNGMLPEPSFQIVLDDVVFGMKNFPSFHRYYQEILDNFTGWSGTEVVKTIEAYLVRSEATSDAVE